MTDANRPDQLEDRLERLETVASEITAAVQANQQQIATAFQAIERLADVVMQVAVRVDNQVEVIAQQQASINAELERQGRILDYLMHRDGNGAGG